MADLNYNIMIRIAKRPNNNSVYMFYKTINADGSSTIFTTSDLQELDATIEELINNGIDIGGKRYLPRVKDLIPMSFIDWYADAITDDGTLPHNLNIATEEDIEDLVTYLFDNIHNIINGDSGEETEQELQIATEEDINNLVNDLFSNDLEDM